MSAGDKVAYLVTGLPNPPKGLLILDVAYRTPKKGEWFLSRYSDSWVQCENKNGVKKQQKHLTLITTTPTERTE